MTAVNRFLGVALMLPVLAACTEGEADEAPSVRPASTSIAPSS